MPKAEDCCLGRQSDAPHLNRANSHSAWYLVSHLGLLIRVARTEMAARYAGSLLGIGWAFVAPLAILAIYAVVYLYIFVVRPTQMTPLAYVLYMFAGLVPFLVTGEAVNGGVSAIVTNKAVLNNTVFPIDLAPVKPVVTAQLLAMVGFTTIIILLALSGRLTWMVLFFPIVWVLHILFLVGLNWILSLIHVVFRDLQYAIGILLMIMLIASPIAYTPDMVPSALKPLIVLNPFAYYVLAFQGVLVLGRVPTVGEWCALLALSGGVFGVGGWLFAKGKRVLVDYA
ncbi:MAG: ABC transporter permease [Nitrospiraceae bacterium]